jgi:hypothetical protein
MRRGPFSAPLTPAAITTTADLFHMTIATDNPIELIAMELYNTTDLQEAQEEVLSIALVRATTGGGTGGTALTEVNYLNADAGAVTTAVLGLNTTVSTGGAVLAHFGWNVRVPFLWCPIPELRPTCDATDDPLVFRLLAAPADSITIGGTIYWFEG